MNPEIEKYKVFRPGANQALLDSNASTLSKSFELDGDRTLLINTVGKPSFFISITAEGGSIDVGMKELPLPIDFDDEGVGEDIDEGGAVLDGETLNVKKDIVGGGLRISIESQSAVIVKVNAIAN